MYFSKQLRDQTYKQSSLHNMWMHFLLTDSQVSSLQVYRQLQKLQTCEKKVQKLQNFSWWLLMLYNVTKKSSKPFCHDSSLACKVNKSKLQDASKWKPIITDLQDSMLQMLHKIKITSLKWCFQHASHIASNKIHNKIKKQN